MLKLPCLIAHRGAKAYAPENTLAAFRLAKEQGARWVEFDVMLTQCGVPVVFHDDASVRRTTNGRGTMAELTIEAVKALDAGRWFSRRFANERVPTLDEALSLCVELGLSANIEIKPCGDSAHDTTIAVLSTLLAYPATDVSQWLMSSFTHECLALSLTIAPELPRGLLLDAWADDWAAKMTKYQCETLHINHRALNEKRVASLKAKGYGVLCYTVNRKRRAKKLLQWGVDSVFSDYPDLLLLAEC